MCNCRHAIHNINKILQNSKNCQEFKDQSWTTKEAILFRVSQKMGAFPEITLTMRNN
jgi:hypothetical protein